MAKQDRRGTADPFYYVIRTEVERITPLGYADYTRYINPENPEEEYDTRADCARERLKQGESERDAKDAAYALKEVGYKKGWDSKNMFLTETDAQAHLNTNYYHYSHNAHTYIEHAWRAPELQQFFKDLFEYFKITGDT